MLLGIAAALALAALAAAALFLTRVRVSGVVTLDSTGHQLLMLDCPRCAEGSAVAVQGVAGKLAAGKVTLRLEPELEPGHQELTVEVGRPPHEYAVTVPVMARFTPDIAPLSDPKPRLSVRVEALPTAAVVLNGRAVALDAQGRGSLELDLTSDLTGPADEKQGIERTLPFTATAPGIAPVRGQLALSVNAVPLRIDAPGDSIVIDSESFMLAGVTQSGGSITVEGRPITVDPTGHFLQRMSVSSVGERTITIRATAPGLAPRMVHVTVRRVADLTPEIERFFAGAERSYAAVAGRLAPDTKVGLEGRVTHIDTIGQRTELVLEVPCDQPACPVRVDYGARTGLQIGDLARVGGRRVGTSREGNQNVPRIEASIVAPGGAP